MHQENAETRRLEADGAREANWKRWGPYLSERQWGTVREDYSASGDAWNNFSHEQSRSRAYRWGEDGLLGWCDRECRLCFAVALWNERDEILKERLFGLTNTQGNHGEDVKELYYYLDSTPTHSYASALYKYPQAAFPYQELIEENARRSRAQPEYELLDTGVFDENRYFDVRADYAKAAPDDTLIRLTISNRGPDAATLHVLPTLWFRNSWSWGCTHEGCELKPHLERAGAGVQTWHATLGRFQFVAQTPPQAWLFTENETDAETLFGSPNESAHVKNAFHHAVINVHDNEGVAASKGTKAAAHYVLEVPAQGEIVLQLRLFPHDFHTQESAFDDFDAVFAQRKLEADAFYEPRLPRDAHQKLVARQAYAGLLWSKQFYHYSVADWLDGDPDQPAPPKERKRGRNSEWRHLFNRDVISMPDAWEYPWYAAWDLAFHTVAFADIDPQFAKDQLLLMLREWYQHPNGQIPAYEWNFGDVNPPVHAWAVWRVYKITGERGHRDRAFLERAFHKLLLNFTWWVNRKDAEGRHIFAGGFLGLDNIGVFDRSRMLPQGATLDQADGTAWMAFFCATMLAISLELASEDACYEDVASKFFEHFVAIVDAINNLGGSGLWDETDGFYYDKFRLERVGEDENQGVPIRLRSMVGLIPLFAAEILDADVMTRLPAFWKRTAWFLRHRPDLAAHISARTDENGAEHRLLAIPSRERLQRVLRFVLDEGEFFSPFGARSLSKEYEARPYVFQMPGSLALSGEVDAIVAYAPGESPSSLFGGNSNWRGPVWMPLNFLLVEALERYGHFYGDDFRVECPTGSGHMKTLNEVARELAGRLSNLFAPDSNGHAAWQGRDKARYQDPNFRDLVLFHEYFHGDTGEGLGASHQTGWTALIARLLDGESSDDVSD